MSHTLQTPPVVARYYAALTEHANAAAGRIAYDNAAIIVQDFHPARGWQPCRMRKRISRSWARKLHREGVTAVAVVPVADPGRAPADFTVAELIRTPR